LIGGLALILNGIVRVTRDADIWLQPTNQNKDCFIDVLLAYGFTDEEVAGMRLADFTDAQIVRIADIPMDVLTQVHQRLNYDECRARSGNFTTKDGQTLHFLHIQDLRESKILARRLKDLNDILMIDELLLEQEKPSNDSAAG
jgi:hypothetical protein